MSSNPEIEAVTPIPALGHPVLDALRDATRDMHSRLDGELAIASEPPDGPLYLRHVAAMLGWIAPLEEALRGAVWPPGLEIERRLRKMDWLVTDLVVGGVSGEAIRALPRCGHVPPVDDPARCFGALYVMEGSTLGGQILYRRLAPHLPGWPLATLTGYGRGTGRMWRIFVATLEQVGTAPGFAEASARAAAETFDALLDWMRFMGAACPDR